MERLQARWRFALLNYPPDYNPDDHITEDIYVLPDWEKRVDEIYRLQTSAVDDQDRYDLFAEFQMILQSISQWSLQWLRISFMFTRTT